MRDKHIAFLLAVIFWWAGFHRFYLWNYFIGFLYLIFFWTFIPFVFAILEALYFLILSKNEFDIKYNYDYMIKQKQLQDLKNN